MNSTECNLWRQSRAIFDVFCQQQCLDPDDPSYGAWVGSDRVPVPGHSGTGLLAAVLLLRAAFEESPPADCLVRCTVALSWIKGQIRTSGRIDSPDCNMDSAPDGAFVVQCWGALLDLLQEKGSRESNELTAVITLMREVMLRLWRGLSGGGFHTPNHRWVMASALARGLLEEEHAEIQADLASYLAEGPDGDPDRFYPERSPAVYDAVSNRSFLLLHRWSGWEEPLSHVLRNLRLLEQLLNGDGTVDTSLSTRQDRTAPTVPFGQVSCLSGMAFLFPGEAGRFQRIASLILEGRGEPSASDCFWVLLEKLQGRLEMTALEPKPPPLPDGSWGYAGHGFWRARRGQWSFSVRTGATFPLVLRSPDGERISFGMAHAYMGTGVFVGDSLHLQEDAWRLHHSALSVPFRPGYEMPIGHRVTPAEYESMRSSRNLRPMPPVASDLSWKWISEISAQVVWNSQDGPDGTYAQLSVDMPAGLTLEGQEYAFKGCPDQVIFLKDGAWLKVTGKTWSLRLGPGLSIHRMIPMRDAPLAPAGGTRILLGLRTPFHLCLNLEWE